MLSVTIYYTEKITYRQEKFKTTSKQPHLLFIKPSFPFCFVCYDTIFLFIFHIVRFDYTTFLGKLHDIFGFYIYNFVWIRYNKKQITLRCRRYISMLGLLKPFFRESNTEWISHESEVMFCKKIFFPKMIPLTVFSALTAEERKPFSDLQTEMKPCAKKSAREAPIQTISAWNVLFLC